MFPWLRLARIACTTVGATQVDLLATTSIRLRAWPNDLDMNLHVNNGRYFPMADIARLHWCVLNGLMARARRQQAAPIVGDAMSKFRRDLKVFQSVEIQTRLLGWDHKWGFIEHRFIRQGRVLGVVAVRALFKGPQGLVDPEILLASPTRSPPLPAWATHFQEGCEAMSELLREEEKGRGLGR